MAPQATYVVEFAARWTGRDVLGNSVNAFIAEAARRGVRVVPARRWWDTIIWGPTPNTLIESVKSADALVIMEDVGSGPVTTPMWLAGVAAAAGKPVVAIRAEGQSQFIKLGATRVHSISDAVSIVTKTEAPRAE
jgi:hypothetical protein